MIKTKIMCYALTLALVSAFLCRAAEKYLLELPFSVGPEYTVTRTSRDSIRSPIPDGEPTTQIIIEVTKDGKEALIFYWDSHPPPHRDLGPMVKKESWPATFLGEDATITRTSLFMGRKQEVLVLHCKLDKYAPVMIYSKDMAKEEFHEMLGKMHRK